MLNHAIQTAVRKREMETPIQSRIMTALAALADENGEVNKSLPDIALRAKACRRTTFTILHELERQGEILILNEPRQRGHYRINHLPDEKKPPVDSLRTPIVDEIRRLELPTRVSVIFEALALYASRTGNNIFPSTKTLMRDTAYSKPVIQETLRWLLKIGFIAPDGDCTNGKSTGKYQTRVGYKIPGWHYLSQQLITSEEQIAQIKALYNRHNRSYWERKAECQNVQDAGWAERTLEDEALTWQDDDQPEDEASWWTEHCTKLEEDQPETSTRFEDELTDEELVEEAPGEEDRAAAAPQDVDEDEAYPGEQDQEGAPSDRPGEELAASLPQYQPRSVSSSSLHERMRLVLSPRHRTNPTVSLKSYHAALEAIQPHLALLTEVEQGGQVDEAIRKRAEQVVRFYQQTIDAYEQQREHREDG